MKILVAFLLSPITLTAQLQTDEFENLMLDSRAIRLYRWHTHDPNTFYAQTQATLNGVRTMRVYRTGKSRESLGETYVYNEKGRILTSVNAKRTRQTTYLNDTLAIKIVATYKNGDVIETTNEFENGRMTGSMHLVNGKKKAESRIVYEEGKVVMQSNENWYRRLPGKKVSHYEDGRETAVEAYRGGRQVHQYHYTYNENGKALVKEHVDMRHRGKYHTDRLENSYNDEGKLIKTILVVDGELTKTWDYSCNDEKGRVIDTEVEVVSSVCTFKEERNDGSYSVFTRRIEKGESYLTESRYNADSMLIGTREFRKDSVLIAETQMNTENERYDYYTKTGKYRYGYEYLFDEDKKITSTRNFNKKRQERYVTKVNYNSKGLVESLEHTTNGKQRSVSRYEYEFAP